MSNQILKIKKEVSVHRGRVQAQGKKLEESIAWTLSIPPTGDDGKKWLMELSNIISKNEAALRADAFQKANDFVEDGVRGGGVYAERKKTFGVRNTQCERVDVEVLKGYAFKIERSE